MIIKKNYNNIYLEFYILENTYIIDYEPILKDICVTFDNTTLLNKQEDFNSPIKKQQKTNKYILINDPQVFDNIRVLIKMINNFLIRTKQSTKFSLETLILQSDELIQAHGSEMYLKDIKDITFSPTARSHWSNPHLMNEIINLG